jgi:dienelactone hydrolase
LLYGANDAWIPADNIASVATHHPDTVVYDDAGHAFMRDGSDDYRPDAAAAGWSRLLDHFATHLTARAR